MNPVIVITIVALAFALLYVLFAPLDNWRRTHGPRRGSLNDAGVKFGPETDPYDDHCWRDAEVGQVRTPFGAPNGTAGYDIPVGTQLKLHDKEFVIPHRDEYPFEKVKTVDSTIDALDMEPSDFCAVRYTELMGRLRSGTLELRDMPPKLPVTFAMLLSMMMELVSANERKCNEMLDRVFALLHRKYGTTAINAVPESRYLELWVDLKQMERGRG